MEPPRTTRDPEALAARAEDAAHHRGACEQVAFPETEGQWAWLLKNTPSVLPVGAQSSLTGGATPAGGTVASTEAMTSLTVAGSGACAGPGVVLSSLLDACASQGMVYPPTPTWTGATLGGTVATDAAGAATFKHGTTRAWVQGLRVVLPDGDIVDLERGQASLDDGGRAILLRLDGTETTLVIHQVTRPAVPKCSAGYFLQRGMDLVDLFIGSEGTLGAVTEVRVALTPRTWQALAALAFFPTEREALEAAGALRTEALATRRSGDPRGLDVSAIEHVDARCLALVAEEGTAARLGVDVPRDTVMALLVVADLPLDLDAATALADLDDPAADTPPVRLVRLLEAHGARRDDVQLALPGEARRLADLIAFREAVPLAVNARIGRLQAGSGGQLRKSGGDVIVPMDRLTQLLDAWHAATGSAGLDALHWGHVSDGNIHPNVLARTESELAAADAAQLAVGRAAIRLGGSPMAEHGVGRNPLKQRLLAEMAGTAGLAAMKAVRRALDPRGVLAPGVLWPGT